MVDKKFFEYVSFLLQESGHMITPDPIYSNHTASETLYIDANNDVTISRFDRASLMQIENVSMQLELEWPGVVEELTERVRIYSITVDVPERNRSQIVADIHHLLHQYWACEHSIVFFKNRNQYVVSFADKDQSHILSDWRYMSWENDDIIEQINVACISFASSCDYFNDFIFAIARRYYVYPISFENASYGMIPLTLMASELGVETGVSKDDVKKIIRDNMLIYETQYGDDYVAPMYNGVDEQAQFKKMAAELEKISFELELAADLESEDSSIFFDDSDDDLEEDDIFDEFDDELDSEIFDDPVLMVKWLERRQKEIDEDEKVQPQVGVVSSNKKLTLADSVQTGLQNENCNIPECKNQITYNAATEPHTPTRIQILSDEVSHKQAEANSKRIIADQIENSAIGIRLTAKQKRIEATLSHSEAVRCTRELAAAECRLATIRTEIEQHIQREAERREHERLEADRRERERLEAERRERERLEAERMEAERREQERLEAERREQERLEAERRERERLEAERRERERLEAERRERERLEAERREQERIQAERLQRELLKQKRFLAAQNSLNLSKDNAFSEWLSRKTSEDSYIEIVISLEIVQKIVQQYRIQSKPLLHISDPKQIQRIQTIVQQKKEYHVLDANSRYYCGLAMRRYTEYLIEQLEIEKHKKELERQEQERLEALRREQERLENERLENERIKRVATVEELVACLNQIRRRKEIEAAKKFGLTIKLISILDARYNAQMEAARVENERLEQERLEAERRLLERLEAERRERERLEAERIERERLEAERLERERLEAERRERERIEAERLERERIDAERREQKRVAEIKKIVDGLYKEFRQEVERINSRYDQEVEQTTIQLQSVNLRLSEIDKKLSALNFLQFIEKRNLNNERDALLSRKAQLIERCKDIEVRRQLQITEEDRKFEQKRITATSCVFE